MVNTSDLWAYLNGELVRGKDAVVPISDRGIQWGDAVYDSTRTYNGVPFRLDERIDRFIHSLYYARIDPGATLISQTMGGCSLLRAYRPGADQGRAQEDQW